MCRFYHAVARGVNDFLEHQGTSIEACADVLDCFGDSLRDYWTHCDAADLSTELEQDLRRRPEEHAAAHGRGLVTSATDQGLP